MPSHQAPFSCGGAVPRTKERPAVCYEWRYLEEKGRRVVAFRGPGDDQRLFWTSRDDGEAVWRPVQELPHPICSQYGPSLAVYDGRVYLAWRGADGDQSLYWTRMTPEGAWEEQRQLVNPPAPDAGPEICSLLSPSLAVGRFGAPHVSGPARSLLVAAWRGADADQAIYWSTFDGETWSRQRRMDAPVCSLTGPSLASYHDALFMAWRGADGDQGLYWSRFGGQAWSHQRAVKDDDPDVCSLDRPCLAADVRHVWMAWRGADADQGVYCSRLQDGAWSKQQRIPGEVASRQGPALASVVPGSALHLFALWRGAGADDGLWWSSYGDDGWGVNLP